MTPEPADPPDAAAFDYDAALQACAAGDRQALSRLYAQEAPRMLGVAHRILRERSAAEDVVHDACVRIWSQAHSFDATRGSGRGWIFTIVRNLALTAARRHGRDIEVDASALTTAEDDEAMARYREAVSSIELGADLGRLQHCLEGLEPVRRQCLLQAYVDGASHGEIAQGLGAPLGTVKAWIRRSLLSLRECLS